MKTTKSESINTSFTIIDTTITTNQQMTTIKSEQTDTTARSRFRKSGFVATAVQTKKTKIKKNTKQSALSDQSDSVDSNEQFEKAKKKKKRKNQSKTVKSKK